MRTGLAPISKHIDALNKAYAHLDNAIDRCESESDYTGLLNDLEASDEPYADTLYQYAWDIVQDKIQRLRALEIAKTRLNSQDLEVCVNGFTFYRDEIMGINKWTTTQKI